MGRALSNWRPLPGDRSCADAERCGKGLAAGSAHPLSHEPGEQFEQQYAGPDCKGLVTAAHGSRTTGLGQEQLTGAQCTEQDKYDLCMLEPDC